MRTQQIANNASASFVASRAMFKGSNLFSAQEGDAYVVYSYGKHYPMLVYYGGQWYENSDKSSMSTERQRYYAARNVSTTKLPTSKLREMISEAQTAALRAARQHAEVSV